MTRRTRSGGSVAPPAAIPPAWNASGSDPGLRRAAERLVHRLESHAGGGDGHRDLLAAVPLLLEAVAGAREGSELQPPASTAVATYRWVAEELRTLTLEEWERLPEQPPATAMLRVLRGFETVREVLDGGADGRLGRLLASYQGMDILVGLAHDLRSPLTSILFLAETLHQERSGLLSELQRRQMGLIYSAALGLTGLANDVIELVRGSRTAEEPAVFSLAELMDSVESLVRPISETRRIPLTIALPIHDRRRGPPVALSRILLNLTTNALRHTDEGQVVISAIECDTERVEFSVQDSGRGLDEAAVRQLQVDLQPEGLAVQAGISGRGLGLTICRKLLSSLDAELEFETGPDHGTRFHFVLRLPPA